MNLSKAGFIDPNAYARDMHRSGGPGLADIGEMRGPGEDNELQRAIWGTSEADFSQAIEHEVAREQADRPHVFVRKLRARR